LEEITGSKQIADRCVANSIDHITKFAKTEIADLTLATRNVLHICYAVKTYN